MPETSIADWLKEHAPDGGADRLRSLAAHQRLGDAGRARRWPTRAPSWSRSQRNPIDAVWADRPEPSKARLVVHPDAICRQVVGRQAPGDRRLADRAAGRRGGAVGARFDRLDVQRPRPGRRPHAGRAGLALVHADGTADLFVAAREDRRRRPPASRQRRPPARARRVRRRARRARGQDRRGRSRARGRGDLRGARQGRREDRRRCATRRSCPRRSRTRPRSPATRPRRRATARRSSRFLHWLDDRGAEGRASTS